ncbi:DUF7503 family protein [Natronosalvus caseinilyticus]
MAENSSLTATLANNPRLMGVLFMICLLLSQAGTVAAGNGSTIG